MIAALKSLQELKNIAPNDKAPLAAMQISTQTTTGFKKLFMSHPPLEERIERLESMAF